MLCSQYLGFVFLLFKTPFLHISDRLLLWGSILLNNYSPSSSVKLIYSLRGTTKVQRPFSRDKLARKGGEKKLRCPLVGSVYRVGEEEQLRYLCPFLTRCICYKIPDSGKWAEDTCHSSRHLALGKKQFLSLLTPFQLSSWLNSDVSLQALGFLRSISGLLMPHSMKLAKNHKVYQLYR